MVSQTLLEEVLAAVASQTGVIDEILVRHLRERFSGLHFSVCRDDDMPSRVPFAAENPVCRLYYVKAGGHCPSLTTDAESATGLVVGLIDQDER